MKISTVVAVGAANEIGKENVLLWRLPKDMQRFKDVTMGHHVLMGRKTWESIPEKFRPLPGRINIVVSRNPDYVLTLAEGTCNPVEGPHHVTSIEAGVEFAKSRGETELMIIGGGEIYTESLKSIADKIYLTVVKQEFPDATVFFPKLDDTEWYIVSQEDIEPDEKNKIAMNFSILERTEE